MPKRSPEATAAYNAVGRPLYWFAVTVCDHLGITRRQLTYWENQGLIAHALPLERIPLYLESDVRQVEAVKTLMERRFTVVSVKALCDAGLLTQVAEAMGQSDGSN